MLKAQSETRPELAMTILVVEDEPIIRMNIGEHLRGCGFRVLEAADANEAIKLLSGGEQVHGIFADIQMPVMDGFELRRWVQQNRPTLKVLLTSGVDKVVAAAGHSGQPRWLVFKPYDVRDVEQRLRELLAS